VISEQEINMIINLTETDHFKKRCRQRGIKNSDINTILEHADTEANVGNGIISYSISNNSILEMKDYISPKKLDRIKNKAVLLSEDGIVITAIKMNKSRSRHYRCGLGS
tara:strand:+ start:601 stop:927 length:327 start_codon:yes stop_codon:yes gene_type:complete